MCCPDQIFIPLYTKYWSRVVLGRKRGGALPSLSPFWCDIGYIDMEHDSCEKHARVLNLHYRNYVKELNQ